jgi:hypothetical protein
MLPLPLFLTHCSNILFHNGDMFIKLTHVTYFTLTNKANFYTLLIEKGNCYHYYCLKRKGENKCMED